MFCVLTVLFQAVEADDSVPQAAQVAQRIARGAELAAIGNCQGCHTTATGPSYAGGVALATPLGTFFGTNITPDPVTGIGAWSEADFERAMRSGIAPGGRHLYPAFPYDHFTHTQSSDLQTLYAYLRTLVPVRAEAPANRLFPPLQVRALIGVWNGLYLKEGPLVEDPTHGAVWNRGAYLANSLGHCASCHSPRNALGAEVAGAAYSGGELDGWSVPALDRSNPSPLPWTADELTVYLREGISPLHAMAGGPMQGVIAQLGGASEADRAAIALYFASLMESPDPERSARAARSAERASRPLALPPAGSLDSRDSPDSPDSPAPQLARGAVVYADTCAGCHERGRRASSGSGLPLPLAVALYEPSADSLIRIVREGILPAPGHPGRWMPAFGDTLTDSDLAALAAFLRRAGAAARPWPDVEAAVSQSRTEPPAADANRRSMP